jgi:hypothetical protein
MADRIAKIAIATLGVALALLMLRQVGELTAAAQNDFVPPYLAAKLAGTGDLYSPHAYYAFMIQEFGVKNDSLCFTRLPFYAALLWPLGRLPFETAYLVWWVIRIAALLVFVELWNIPSRGGTLLFTMLSVPVFAALVSGQDTLFLLLLIALALCFHEKGKDFAAGFALSLCAIKFHLFVLAPLLLWRQPLHRMRAGFVTGAAALATLSFAVEGWQWPVEYFRILTNGRVHPEAETMPNLHGLLAGLPQAPYLEALAAAAVVAGAWISLRDMSFRQGFAVVLLGGLLLSYHSYVMDAVILLPALLIVIAEIPRAWIKTCSALMLSPLPALVLLSQTPWARLTQAALLLMFWAVLYGAAAVNRRPTVILQPRLEAPRSE